jgi:hypothetical protein
MSYKTWRKFSIVLAKFNTMSGVPSVDASSATIISSTGERCEATLSSARGINPARFLTGITAMTFICENLSIIANRGRGLYGYTTEINPEYKEATRRAASFRERARRMEGRGRCVRTFAPVLVINVKVVLNAGDLRNVSLLVAIAVNGEGYREILGICEGAKEDKAGSSAFLKHLKERGLNGVRLIISDACLGLAESAAEFFPDAVWQRCVVHWYRNIFSHVPATKVREIAEGDPCPARTSWRHARRLSE